MGAIGGLLLVLALTPIAARPDPRLRAHPAGDRGARRRAGAAWSSARRSDRPSGGCWRASSVAGVLSSVDRFAGGFARRGTGDPDRLARGRAAGRGPVPHPRPRGDAVGGRARRRPVPAAADRGRGQDRRGARRLGPPRRVRRPRPDPAAGGRHAVRPAGGPYREGGDGQHGARRDPCVRHPGQRHGRARRPRLSRHQRPRRRRRVDRPRRARVVGRRRRPRPVRPGPRRRRPLRAGPRRPVAALRDDGPGAGRRGCGARVRRAAGRSSCCRPRSRARTRPPATTSTTPAWSRARSSSSARRSSPATPAGR